MLTRKEPNSIFRFHVHSPETNHVTGMICGLSEGESRYIYHHLRSGCILNAQVEWQSGSRCLYGLYYGSHRLGRMNTEMSNRLTGIIGQGIPCRITIGAVIREKYLPPSAIEIDLEWGEAERAKAA